MVGDWYYARNGSFEGPETASRLLELLNSGHIDKQTPIWRHGALDWEPLHSALRLADGTPPPIPGGWKPAFPQTAANEAQLGEQTAGNTKHATQTVVKGKKKSRGHWLLWWKVDQVELDKQVSQYDSLGILHSARGMSVLCLAFSSAITLVLVAVSSFGIDSSAYVDVTLFAFLALFIYLGHRWAMIAAMIFWTLEKGLIIVQGLGPVHTSAGIALGQLLWWSIYMHAFYFALRVEQQKRKNGITANANVLKRVR